MNIKESDKVRFWSKVQKSDNSTHCWLWTGYRLNQGYGRFWMNGQLWLAHRISYLLSFGDIDENLFVCHHCDNPSCVNPSHLWLGSNKDNVDDKLRKGRTNGPLGETHGRAKLTREQILTIRSTVSSGGSRQLIARQFGVSGSCIQNIVKRRSWAWLQEGNN